MKYHIRDMSQGRKHVLENLAAITTFMWNKNFDRYQLFNPDGLNIAWPNGVQNLTQIVEELTTQIGDST